LDSNRGKSEHHRARCWVIPSEGDLKESATENTPPMALNQPSLIWLIAKAGTILMMAVRFRLIRAKEISCRMSEQPGRVVVYSPYFCYLNQREKDNACL